MNINLQQLLSGNDEVQQRTMLTNILNGLFAGEISVEDLFSPAYKQSSDGNTLDFIGFTNHLVYLRSHVSNVEFDVLNVCICEDRLAERHIATITHHDGQVSRLEVYVFMRLQHQKIASLDEITRVISGKENDKELASAIS